MPQVLEFPLDARVTPSGVLASHADDEPPDLLHHARTAHPSGERDEENSERVALGRHRLIVAVRKSCAGRGLRRGRRTGHFGAQEPAAIADTRPDDGTRRSSPPGLLNRPIEQVGEAQLVGEFPYVIQRERRPLDPQHADDVPPLPLRRLTA
jgi:hypothetical protein